VRPAVLFGKQGKLEFHRRKDFQLLGLERGKTSHTGEKLLPTPRQVVKQKLIGGNGQFFSR